MYGYTRQAGWNLLVLVVDGKGVGVAEQASHCHGGYPGNDYDSPKRMGHSKKDHEAGDETVEAEHAQSVACEERTF